MQTNKRPWKRWCGLRASPSHLAQPCLTQNLGQQCCRKIAHASKLADPPSKSRVKTWRKLFHELLESGCSKNRHSIVCVCFAIELKSFSCLFYRDLCSPLPGSPVPCWIVTRCFLCGFGDGIKVFRAFHNVFNQKSESVIDLPPSPTC